MSRKNFFSKKEAMKIHGDIYDYSEYKCEDFDVDSVGLIKCPKHGGFFLSPRNHIINRIGCWSCSKQVSNDDG